MLQKTFLLAFSAVCLLTLFAQSPTHAQEITHIDILVGIELEPDGSGSLYPRVYTDEFEPGESISIRAAAGATVFVTACVGGNEFPLGVVGHGDVGDFDLPDDFSTVGNTITLKFQNRLYDQGTADIHIVN